MSAKPLPMIEHNGRKLPLLIFERYDAAGDAVYSRATAEHLAAILAAMPEEDVRPLLIERWRKMLDKFEERAIDAEEALSAERAAREEAERVNREILDAAWEFSDPDPEHTIRCHADALPKMYEKACAVIAAIKAIETGRLLDLSGELAEKGK